MTINDTVGRELKLKLLSEANRSMQARILRSREQFAALKKRMENRVGPKEIGHLFTGYKGKALHLFNEKVMLLN